MTSGGTNFHKWYNSELAGTRDGISHRKFEFFDLNATINYESANGGPSLSLLCVEHCNLHNSIISTPRWNRLGCGHNRHTERMRRTILSTINSIHQCLFLLIAQLLQHNYGRGLLQRPANTWKLTFTFTVHITFQHGV